MLTQFYQETDISNYPNYTIAETARYLHLSKDHVSLWLSSNQQNLDLIDSIFPVYPNEEALLSFINLLQIYIFNSIRLIYQFSSLKFGQNLKMIYRLNLPDKELNKNHIHLLINNLETSLHISISKQMSTQKKLEIYLNRIEWNTEGIAQKFYPFINSKINPQSKLIVIDPNRGFGRPILTDYGVPTTILAQRFKAGESIDELMADYECVSEAIQKGIAFQLKKPFLRIADAQARLCKVFIWRNKADIVL